MTRRFRVFVRGLSTNWIGTAGVVLTTTAFILFVFLEILRIAGIVTNTYVGLVTYMTLPALFLFGLLLIPLGWRRYRKSTGYSTRELLSKRFPPELVEPKPFGSRLLGMISLLTLVNVLFLGLGGARMLHFMDQPVFCGTACHGVMIPEWTAYQDSPHAHVKCVECHVGEGAEALIDAKLNGLWQIVSATFHLYEKPIPTPVHQLRPARETCEKCHWPARFYGDRIKVVPHYLPDSTSTPTYTTLALKVGSGKGGRGQIHWHVAPNHEVRYASVGDEREEMLWVEMRGPDGNVRRFTNRTLVADAVEEGDPGVAGKDAAEEAVRTMDCVDCHNRATHIYEDPERAVDRAIAQGKIDRGLPFVKRQALGALIGSYAGVKAAMAGIQADLAGYYARHYRRETASLQPELDRAVATVQAIYRRNIHPHMNVTWNPYPDHLGHRGGGREGCFRCHNRDMVDAEGKAIPYDCTLCHSILSYDSPDRFQFLLPVREKDPNRAMHRFLQTEFLGRP